MFSTVLETENPLKHCNQKTKWKISITISKIKSPVQICYWSYFMLFEEGTQAKKIHMDSCVSLKQ